jgi:methyltransferase (TIGR00027 family)
MMNGREPLVGVSKTALGVAFVRAQESRRPDRLFDDPYALAFLAAAPGAFPAVPDVAEPAGPEMTGLGAVLGWQVVIRTRCYDDYLTAAGHAGCRQVVLLAAGLDTRAYRLAWPDGTRLFEVDLPEVLDFKQQVLTDRSARPGCRRTVVAADLRGPWPQHLIDSGFDPGSATAWLVEGLFIYLSADEVTRLLGDITALSGPGSQIAFEHGSPADSTMFGEDWTRPGMREFTDLWKGGLGDEAPAWMTGHGWRVRTQDAAGLGESFGRPAPVGSGGGFLTAVLDQPG